MGGWGGFGISCPKYPELRYKGGSVSSNIKMQVSGAAKQSNNSFGLVQEPSQSARTGKLKHLEITIFGVTRQWKSPWNGIWCPDVPQYKMSHQM